MKEYLNKVDKNYIYRTLEEKGIEPEEIVCDTYPEIKVNRTQTSLVDHLGNPVGTKGDMYHKQIMHKILQEGTLEEKPRPVYIDGTPAYTLSYNHGMTTYDISKGESPFTTLRPIAWKSAVAELLWIYQHASNDLVMFDELLGKNTWEETHTIHNWWEEWAIRDEKGNYILNDLGHPTIGAVYGETVRRRNMTNELLDGLRKDPFGRRHIINLWQTDDFKEPHGLKPCAFLTEWNVRKERNGKKYLDLMLTQRSSDFATAGCINQVQYLVFLFLVARHLGLEPGRFSWNYNNIQLYDRHINQAITMLNREPIDCQPNIVLNNEKRNFYDFKTEDITLEGYPLKLIKEKNPQLKFPLGI